MVAGGRPEPAGLVPADRRGTASPKLLHRRETPLARRWGGTSQWPVSIVSSSWEMSPAILSCATSRRGIGGDRDRPGRQRPPQGPEWRLDRRDHVCRRHPVGPHGRDRQRIPDEGFAGADRGAAEARHLGKGRQEKLQIAGRRRADAIAGRQIAAVVAAAAARCGRRSGSQPADDFGQPAAAEAGPPDDDIPF